jgi:hypothetical protein
MTDREPMQGLADYLRAQAWSLSCERDPLNVSGQKDASIEVLCKWAAEVEAARRASPAPADADFVQHTHPDYGPGYFCTPDVFAKLAAQPPAVGPTQAIDLHAAIMNIPCRAPVFVIKHPAAAYRAGHRDARHAAAELASAHQAAPLGAGAQARSPDKDRQ